MSWEQFRTIARFELVKEADLQEEPTVEHRVEENED